MKKNVCFRFILYVVTLLGGVLGACSSSNDEKTDIPPIDEPAKETLVPSPKENTIYGTWVNVWVSSSESWWKEEHSCGLQTLHADGTWKGIDWNNWSYRQTVYENIKNAGVDFIIADNTNGLMHKTDALIADLERENIDLKFCVAYSAHLLKDESALNWLDKVSKNPRYFKIDDKPVVACYVAKEEWFSNFVGSQDPILKNFYRLWASGEDTYKNKCGWQVEPEDGIAPESNFVTFATPSVWHKYGNPSYWSKSIAMLDYTFWQTRVCAPQYVVAASYDDYIERNGWLPLKTENPVLDGPDLPKITPLSGIQMFDPWSGGIADPYLFYNRMKAWIKGEELHHIPGGVLSDGIYRIKKVNGDYLQTTLDYEHQNTVLGRASSQTFDKFVFYHLGSDKYRIVNVYTGKPLKSVDGTILSADWTSADDGVFQLVLDDGVQEWELEPVGTFIENESKLKCNIITSDGNPMS